MEKRQIPLYVELKRPDSDEPFLYPAGYDQSDFDAALKYKAQADDVFLCSYAKSGTTWLANIVWLILHRGDPIPEDAKLRQYIPFLEMDGNESAEAIDTTDYPRVVKTHLPYALVSMHPEAKYLNIIRNPKDTLVSYYYHVKGFVVYFQCPDLALDDIFDLYVNGQVSFGGYFDHVVEWYKKRHEPNVLFLLYEDLKVNTRENVLKIARFLGEDYEKSLLENNEALLQKILELSSFKTMKSEGTKWCTEKRPDDLPFIRKGEVGDWRNHLSKEQSAIMDRLLKEKGHESGLDRLWDNHPDAL